ncbi:MAG: contact-dependent growth inhibition system immunity protein [Jatrophihabitantaceae bacterium]
MTEYPTLWHFFGAYLYQDWLDEYADEWAAVDGFIADCPPEYPRLLRAEIAALLAEHPTEEEVRKVVFDDLGSCYLAEVDGWKYRDWLKALSDHAAKAIGHPQAS